MPLQLAYGFVVQRLPRQPGTCHNADSSLSPESCPRCACSAASAPCARATDVRPTCAVGGGARAIAAVKAPSVAALAAAVVHVALDTW